MPQQGPHWLDDNPLLQGQPPVAPKHWLDDDPYDPLATNLQRATETPQAHAQKLLQLQSETRLPSVLVEQNYQALDALSRTKQIDPDHLRRVSPAVATWLTQNPLHAAAAPAEEIHKLADLERVFGVAAPVVDALTSPNYLTRPVLRGFYGGLGDLYGAVEVAGQLLHSDRVKAYSREGQDRMDLIAAAYGESVGLRTAFSGPRDFGDYVYNAFAQNLPMMGLSYAGGLAGGLAKTPLLYRNITWGQFLGAFLPSSALGTGGTERELKQLSPNAEAPLLMVGAGGVIGFLDTAFPALFGARLLETFGPVLGPQVAKKFLEMPIKPQWLTRTASGFIEGAKAEAIPEAFQEIVQALAAAVGADKSVDWRELPWRALESGVAGAIVGGVTGGLQEGVTTPKAQRQWEAARQQQAIAQSIGGIAADSQVLQQLPTAGRQYIAEATVNGPLETVYLPIKTFEEFFQARGDDPVRVAEELTGSRDALAQAKADGVEVFPVAMADYATKIAPNPHMSAFFAAEMKLAPGIENLRENAERNERNLREAQGEAAARRAEAADAEAFIKQSLSDQWVARGAWRWQANNWAALHAARYLNRAERKGEDVRALFQRDPRRMFYVLANGDPLVPFSEEERLAAAATRDPLVPLDLPPATVTEARAEGLEAAWAAQEATPATPPPGAPEAPPAAPGEATGPAGEAGAAPAPEPGVALADVGFTPEEVSAFEAVNLATAGRMSPDQYAEYQRTRSQAARAETQRAAQASALADIPESVAPPNETSPDRSRRRDAQIRSLASTLLGAGQTRDPSLTFDTVYQALVRRFDYEQERLWAIDESGRGQALLRAIQQEGGIWYREQTGGERGEVLFFARDSRDPKDQRERGGRDAQTYVTKEWDNLRTGATTRGIVPTWNGVPGVFQRDGKTPDDMARDLRNNGDFPNMHGPRELFRALGDALAADREVDSFPGTADLGRIGIDPTTAWWQGASLDPEVWAADDQEFGPLPAEVDDTLALGEGDPGAVIAFDPAAFEQRAKAGQLPHGARGFDDDEGGHEVRLPGGAGEMYLLEPVAAPKGYLFIDTSGVKTPGQGDGRRLYEAALAYAIGRGYKGLSSDPATRGDASNGMWRALAREGVVTQREGADGRSYDVVTYTGGDFFQRTPERAALPQEFWQRKAAPKEPTDRTPHPRALDVGPAERLDDALLVSTAKPSTAATTPDAEGGIIVTDLALLVKAGPDKVAQAADVFRSYALLTTAERRLTDPMAVLRAAIDAMKRNLRALWDRYPEAWRERAKVWYAGANRLANDYEPRYRHRGWTVDQFVGVLATQSPQMDWYKNVSLADRIIETVDTFDAKNPTFEPRHLRQFVARQAEAIKTRLRETKLTGSALRDFLAEKQAERRMVRTMVGERWRAMTLTAQAVFVRMHDELDGDYRYRVISPEGDRGAYVYTDDDVDVQKTDPRPHEVERASRPKNGYEVVEVDGQRRYRIRRGGLVRETAVEPKRGVAYTVTERKGQRVYRYLTTGRKGYETKQVRAVRGGFEVTTPGVPARISWGTYPSIENGISILRDGSPGNISERVGGEHKVRSFYNNNSHPWDGRSVTVDTHAVAAAFLSPFSASAREVKHTMGTNPTGDSVTPPKHKATGLSGTNAVVATAYFELAAELQILVRELQSPTWEAIRSVFTPEQKRSKKGKALAKKVARINRAYTRGKISHDEFVSQVFAAAQGTRPETFVPPAWAAVPPSDEGRMATASGRPRRDPVPARPGDRGADPTRPAGRGADQRDGVIRADRAGAAAVAVAPGPRRGRRVAADPDEFHQAPAGRPVGSALAMFYSRLTQPVRDAKAEAASGRDWKAIITGAKTGINQDEYLAVGVDALDDTTTYTRGEVLAFLQAHQIHVEIVELASPDELIDPDVLRREADRIYADLVAAEIRSRDRAGDGPRVLDETAFSVRPRPSEPGEPAVIELTVDGDVLGQTFESFDAAVAAGRAEITARNALDAARVRADVADYIDYARAEQAARSTLREQNRDREAHYSSYVLPGAEAGTYRERFLTAPKVTEPDPGPARAVIEQALATVSGRDLTDEEFDAVAHLTRLRNLGDYATTTNWAETRLGRSAMSFDRLTGAANDAVDRLFFGLAGAVAKVNMQNLGVPWTDGHPGYNHITNPVVRVRDDVQVVPAADGAPRLTVLRLEEIQPPLKVEAAGINEFDKMPVLFQKNWLDLGLRWALQHAAVMGYDAVVWTTGEMQVKRYPGIQKAAAWISYHTAQKRLAAVDADGKLLLEKRGVEPADVARFFSQATADRLFASEPMPSGGEPFYQVAGAGEMVGGEHLRHVYDVLAPRTANKLPVMRRTGTKVTTVTLPRVVTQMTYIGPALTRGDILQENALRADLSVQLRGQAKEVAAAMLKGATFEAAMVAHGSIALAAEYGGTLITGDHPATVPAIEMTPALRGELLGKGQEFFQAGRRESEGNAPYQQDIFGTPLAPRDRFAPDLPTRVEMVTQGSRALPVSTVQSAEDAAAALGYLSRGAQERFDGLVVDDAGTPLAVIGSFKGTAAETRVHVDVLLAEALNVPGAATVWFAHNHPTGDPALSPDDRRLAQRLQTVFRETGIRVGGLHAIGAGFGAARQWEHTVDGRETTAGAVRVGEPGVATTVPVQEREFVALDKLDRRAITTPALAAVVVPEVAQGRFGIVFVDTQHRATGFVPLDETAALTLKAGGAQALYQTWAQTGSRRAFVYAPDIEFATRARARNVAEALHAIDVEVLDIVDPDGASGLSPRTLTGAFTQADEEGGDVRGGFNRFTGWIKLVAGVANLSTFLHESGHAFLHELMSDALQLSLQDPATQNDLQRKVVTDAHTALRWFGFEGTIGDFLALSTEDQRQMHEQWARGFEVYLMTGVAPSAELRGLFATMKAWLLTAYRLVRGRPVSQADAEAAVSRDAGFTVTLPQEVREVMDRLLASDEAIATMRAESEVTPLFTDAASAGMNPLEWAAYEDTVRAASMGLQEEVHAKVLADWRHTQQAEWQREREQVHAEVLDELHALPVVAAASLIRTGLLPDGSVSPVNPSGAPMRLSKAALVRMKGEAFLRTLPRPYLYTVEGGLHPDVVAELTGFTSGDAMLDALVAARNPNVVAEQLTDQRMRARHGDQILDGLDLHAVAEQAIHDHRAEIISAELQALTKGMVAKSIPTAAQLKAHAVARVGAMTVRETTPGLFLYASTRAAQRTADAFARNDRAAAVQHLGDQLSLLALYRAATTAKARTASTVSLMQAYDTSPGRRRILRKAGAEYLEQIDALLERYEFRKVSQRALDRRESLRAFVADQEKLGQPVQIPAWLIDDTRKVNYTQLTNDELGAIRETVEHIRHLARLKTHLMDARAKKELAEVRSEISSSIYSFHRVLPTVHESRLGMAAVKGKVDAIHYSHRKIASLIRTLDGWQSGGPMWDWVGRRVNEAGNNEAVGATEMALSVQQLFEDHYSHRERRAFNLKRAIPELNLPGQPAMSGTKQLLLMLAMNQGNDTNRQRVRDGWKWTQEQVDAALAQHLDKRDWDWVQGVIDYYETFWQRIVDKQLRVTGIAPEKVQAAPILTKFGVYRGGYAPIVFDGEASSRNQSLKLATVAQLQHAAAYVHTTTARGHVERRATGDIKGRPVRLDFNVITEHLAQVIHDLTHHEMLIDVTRIIDADHEVGQAIQATQGVEAYEQFRGALRDIALGDVSARLEVSKLQTYLKGGATISGLGWNAMTTVLQLVGVNQSMRQVGVKWIGRGTVSFWRGAITMNGQVKAIRNESLLMRNRLTTNSPELRDVQQELGIESGRFTATIDSVLRGLSMNTITKQAVVNSYMALIARSQMVPDIVTYLGAKAKAVEDPAYLRADGTLDEERIIAYAEQMVLDTQGGGQLKDLAAIQRAPEWKMWTTFYSVFNTTFQMFAESFEENGGRLRMNWRDPVAMGRIAVDFLLLVTLPSVVTHLIRSGFRGTLGDELEDPEELIMALCREQLSYMLNTMVIARELTSFVEGYYNYEGPAATRGIPVVGRALGSLVKSVQAGELDSKLARNLNFAGGILFHYPSGQVDKTFRGFMAWLNGETKNPAAVLFGPPPE